jgi:HK97 family phage prohead protease
MLLKKNSVEVKDFDDKKGVVVAYANVYDFKDSDGDISAKGSFVKTTNENYKRIRVLKDHNPTISLGVPLEIDSKDNFGLLTKTQFNLEKEVARDMFSDIKLYVENGLNAELSIGYEVVKRDEKDRSIIKEYKLYEYSFLTSWAANELSTVQGMKSLMSQNQIIELITKSYNMDYSDERLIEIEKLLKSLTQEPLKDTPKDEPIDKQTQLNNFLKSLKL